MVGTPSRPEGLWKKDSRVRHTGRNAPQDDRKYLQYARQGANGSVRILQSTPIVSATATDAVERVRHDGNISESTSIMVLRGVRAMVGSDPDADRSTSVMVGEVHTGILQHSSALSASSAADLMGLVTGESQRIFGRPISYVQSPIC